MREEQFLRLELLIGKENVEKLHRKRITLVGAGAVGGYAFESLVRSGIGFIRIVDFDTFCLSNLNRQILATYDTIGMPKVDAAKARALSINPDMIIESVNAFADDSNYEEIVKNADLVIDCIDSVDSKVGLMMICEEKDIPVISSMGAALRRDISRIRVTTLDKTCVCPLAKAVRTKARKLDLNLKRVKVVFSDEEVVFSYSGSSGLGSLAPVTAVFGQNIANEALKTLIGEDEFYALHQSGTGEE